MRYDFMILDVFTDTQFGGNRLAVLTDARGLTSEGMQIITREFNFPETSFVLPADDPAHAARVRIFTPGAEMPFAGHPTVGTACALVMSGAVGPGEIVLEENVGPVPVAVQKDTNLFSARFRLDRPPEAPDILPSVSEVAKVVSLPEDDIVDVFGAGMGVRLTYVQVPSREVVDRSQLDMAAWRATLADAWGPSVYVFAGDLTGDGEIYSRMYGPGFGIPEDPATGAAAAAIVGNAAQRAGRSLNLDIRQGVKMGRPSLIKASARFDGGTLKSIEVGGGSVFVAEGQTEVPERFRERD